MKSNLLDLFAYTKWANQEFINILEKEKVEDEQSLVWMSHIFNAYEFWLSRIEHYKPNYELWEKHSVKELSELNKNYMAQISTLIQESSDAELFREVGYKSSNGKPFSSLLKDILTHISNHSTHHRAQIASRLSAAGLTIPPTDYIYFKRD